MPIKSITVGGGARGAAGPSADDLSGGTALIPPSAPVPAIRVPGSPGYTQPEPQSIYSRTRWADRTTYVVSSALAATNVQVNFPVYSIVVDNQSSQWLRFRGSHQRFIPPWVWGMVLRTGGEDNFQVTVEAPAGITQAAIGTSVYYTISATEEKLPPTGFGFQAA